MPTVLIVEDDRPTRKALTYYLRSQGYTTLEAEDGAAALDSVHIADVILLDIMLPVLDGWQVAQFIYETHPEKPVITLTALGGVVDRLHGFDLGVDDYMIKPVNLHELGARIKALLRRSGYRDLVIQGPLHVNLAKRTVTLHGQPLQFTPLEFDVLAVLIRNPGRIWSRNDLIAAAWGIDFEGVDRTVDVRMAKIRRKLEADTPQGQFIRTIRGIGYQFVPQERDSEKP